MFVAGFRITFPGPFGNLYHHGACSTTDKLKKGTKIQVMDTQGNVSPYPAVVHSSGVAARSDYAFKFVGEFN